jgi:hypothetical protein
LNDGFGDRERFEPEQVKKVAGDPFLFQDLDGRQRV